MEKFYYFTDGAGHYFRNVDTVLRTVCHFIGSSGTFAFPNEMNSRLQTLDGLLSEHLSLKMKTRIPSTSSLFQAAQVITNIEHFLAALPELEQQLAKLR